MRGGIGFIIAIVLVFATLGAIMGGAFSALMTRTYTYKTLQGSFGQSRSCYKQRGSLFCETDSGIIQVSEFELD